MAKLISQEHGGLINRFEKGESGNPNGRPKKYVTTLKEVGYKVSEINDTIQVLMTFNLQELKAVIDNETATILEKTIANAMMKSYKRGSLYSIDTLLTRVFGKPKEQVETRNYNSLMGKIEIEVKTSNVPLSNREIDVDLNKNV